MAVCLISSLADKYLHVNAAGHVTGFLILLQNFLLPFLGVGEKNHSESPTVFPSVGACGVFLDGACEVGLRVHVGFPPSQEQLGNGI